MRIATWNVNSLKARLPRVEQWIEANAPDVLLLQETKCADAAFPVGAFGLMGYESAHHGDGRWNGVAIVSRVGLAEVQAGFFEESAGSAEERRLISATCGGIRVMSVYVPNGRAVDSEHYAYKLDWLAHLRRDLDAHCSAEDAIVIAGDFNIAPEDRDVWDITKFDGMTHVTPAERDAFAALVAFGLEDAVRHVHPDGDGPFSWWDYRAGSFHRGWGMRIDHLLCSAPVMRRLARAEVDREARKGPQPSDHAPVLIDLVDEEVPSRSGSSPEG